MLSVIAICIGACVGALSRWQLGLWLNPSSTDNGIFPWGTLAANLIGGYLIGLCAGVFQNMPQLAPEVRLLCITGFLGALTTFSTFSVEVVSMLQQGRIVLALLTAGVHLLGSLLLTYFGLYTVKLLGISPMP
ncbi:MAG: putative fluoride ion transporter CrcB [Pseudomonadota bacterium]|jgi:CrcB protein